LVDSDDPSAKFKAAKTKAAKVGIENLSDEDVKGLSRAQLRELRGVLNLCAEVAVYRKLIVCRAARRSARSVLCIATLSAE
jgi:hypothetical protein